MFPLRQRSGLSSIIFKSEENQGEQGIHKVESCILNGTTFQNVSYFLLSKHTKAVQLITYGKQNLMIIEHVYSTCFYSTLVLT